jgi:hypothetical protein
LVQARVKTPKEAVLLQLDKILVLSLNEVAQWRLV